MFLSRICRLVNLLNIVGDKLLHNFGARFPLKRSTRLASVGGSIKRLMVSESARTFTTHDCRCGT